MLFLNVCCLLQTRGCRCPGASAPWKGLPLTDSRRPETVTRGPDCLIPVTSPAPPPPHTHTHAHAPRMEASGTPALPPRLCRSCWQDGPTQDRVDAESRARALPGRVGSGAHGAACSPSVPGAVRTSALPSTARTSISRRKDSPGETTLNCDPQHLSTSSPPSIPVCDGQRVYCGSRARSSRCD